MSRQSYECGLPDASSGQQFDPAQCQTGAQSGM